MVVVFPPGALVVQFDNEDDSWIEHSLGLVICRIQDASYDVDQALVLWSGPNPFQRISRIHVNWLRSA